MHKLEIIDSQKPIVLLKWIGVVDKEEALAIIPEIKAVHEKLGRNFYFIVDTSEFKLTTANEEFVEHQRVSLPLINKIAVVVNSSVTKLQIRKMAEGSKNDKEAFFNNYEECVAYLKSL